MLRALQSEGLALCQGDPRIDVQELAIYFAGPGNAEHERIPPTVPLTAGLPLHTHNDSDSHGHTKAVRAAAFLPPGYQVTITYFPGARRKSIVLDI